MHMVSFPSIYFYFVFISSPYRFYSGIMTASITTIVRFLPAQLVKGSACGMGLWYESAFMCTLIIMYNILMHFIFGKILSLKRK